MTEIEIRDELREKRNNIKTFDDLIDFLKDVKENYNCNPEKSKDMDDWYGACPRIVAEAALATAWFFSGEQGMTGFQAGFVKWEFILGWDYQNNKCGLKLIDYDHMLYPQYEDVFQKTISETTWKKLQEEAKRQIEEDNSGEMPWKANPDVRKHWESIVNGVVPFGYSVRKD